MKESIIAKKSFEFAKQIVELYKVLCISKEYNLSTQLLRSGTSIGANVYEGIQAQSRADFISKMNIALKEAHETLYWIELLFSTEYLNKEQYDKMINGCRELVSILVAIVKTSKANR